MLVSLLHQQALRRGHHRVKMAVSCYNQAFACDVMSEEGEADGRENNFGAPPPTFSAKTRPVIPFPAQEKKTFRNPTALRSMQSIDATKGWGSHPRQDKTARQDKTVQHPTNTGLTPAPGQQSPPVQQSPPASPSTPHA